MKTNMGSADRILRIVIAGILVAVFYYSTSRTGWAVLLPIVAAIFLATSLVGFCPLYTLLGIRTKHNQQRSA